jgi:glycosyltransferase involved in cell wall biosynthesis
MIIGTHHESPFYRDHAGRVYIVSFIGIWLDGLSQYWEEVIYYGYETHAQLPMEDYCVVNENVRFVSLGQYGGLSTLIPRILSLVKAMNHEDNKSDVLLIRGPTPRQATIIRAFKGNNVAFYMVGEAEKRTLLKTIINGGMKGLITKLLLFRRRLQTRRIVKKCLLICNSMELVERYESLLKRKICFAPSSSFKREDIFHVVDRCLGDEISLLFVGRICKAKGVPELLKAFQILQNNKTGRKIYTLHIVGEVAEGEFIEDYKTIAKQLSLDDSVIWHGRVPYGPKLFDFYHNADMLISPSKHEGFPHVIIEALGNGVIALVSPVGGIPRECAHKREVYFIKESPESIAEAINEIASDKRLRVEMIRNGYEFIESKLVGKCEETLSNILKENFKDEFKRKQHP